MEARPKIVPVPLQTGTNHPIVDILARADYDAFRERLADDVVFHSPVAHFRFKGKDITGEQFERIVKVSDLDHWKVKGFTPDITVDTHVVAISTRIRGHKLDLLTVTQLNEHFKVQEMWAYARPMASIGIFPAYVFPHLAKKFGDRARGRLAELFFRPLPDIVKAINHAGLGYARPPECEFEANLPEGERSPAEVEPPAAAALPAAPSGPRSPFRRL